MGNQTVKKLHLALALCALACALTTTASAASIGFKLAATDPDAATSSLAANEVAGVVPQANWNNLAGATGTNVGGHVLDTGGAATGTTVSWSGPNTWRSTTGNNAFAAGPNRKLTAGYLDSNDTAAGGANFSINNIPASLRAPAYNVYVYFVSDSGANRGGAYTINDGSGDVVKYGSTLAMPSAFVEDPGTDADLSLDGTHLVFRRLTGANFTLGSNTTLTTPNGFRAPINAVQIVGVPEPSSLLITCGAALLGVFASRRRRA
jgi:hypothetical protein